VSLVLAGASGGLGLLLAHLSMAALEKMISSGLAGTVVLPLDPRAVAFRTAMKTSCRGKGKKSDRLVSRRLKLPST